MRGYRLVGTARYILESSISIKLAKEIFDLAEEKLREENDKETRKKLHAIKTVIAIVFPKELTNSQISNALNNIKL